MLSDNPVPTTGGDARKIVFAVIAVIGVGLISLLLYTGSGKADAQKAMPAAAEQGK